MRIVGVDENGLGPRLGPLIATAVTLVLDREYDRVRYRRLGVRLGIDDSKQTSAHGRMADAESLALALLEQQHGRAPNDVEELLELLVQDGALPLRTPCPTASSAQCWSMALPLPAFGGEIAVGRKQLAKLARAGVVCEEARSIVACAGVMNAELRRLGSRTSVDLSLFERLVLGVHARTGEELDYVLGMVGGIRDYRKYLDQLRDRELELIERAPNVVRYRIEGLARLSFEIDADARHMPVALASMIGKYLREVLMERQNRFYAAHAPTLPRPSGYYDPVTRKFIAASRGLRRRLGIADACFER